jgi:hypothetical protein
MDPDITSLCIMPQLQWSKYPRRISTCYLLPLRPECLLQCPTLQHSQTMLFPLTWEAVLHPYQPTAKLIVLYILIFIFPGNNQEDKIFCTKWEWTLPKFNVLNFFIHAFCFVRIVPKCLNFATFLQNLLPVFMLWLFLHSVHVSPYFLLDKPLY